MITAATVSESPLLDEAWPGTFPDAPLLHLAGCEEDEEGGDPHICRGID